MNMTIEAPAGTYGLAIAPWSEDEIYAVAADWAEAACPVYRYCGSEWCQTGRQVADYQHSPEAALYDELAAAIMASGEDASEIPDLDDAEEI